jgi:hypothetical protein
MNWKAGFEKILIDIGFRIHAQTLARMLIVDYTHPKQGISHPNPAPIPYPPDQSRVESLSHSSRKDPGMPAKDRFFPIRF